MPGSIADRLPGGGLAGLRAEIEDELRTILARYHIPELDAEDLLRETTLEVLYKSQSPGEFAVRLGPTLRGRCRMYWETRRWRSYGPPAVRPVAAPPPASEPEGESAADSRIGRTRIRAGMRQLMMALGLRKERR